jgi:hypothetical protein
MISFSSLGNRGRLGNQLFQYAFLRTAARKLGVKFHCPAWIGDQVFDLNDQDERALSPQDIVRTYSHPPLEPGFHARAMDAGDGTDYDGYFQSERYFESEPVNEWYRFKDRAVHDVRKKYEFIDFHSSVGMHVRLTDFLYENNTDFYVARSFYYKRALERISRGRQVLVFSDDIPLARKLIGTIDLPLVLIEGNLDYEDLYLESLCRDFVCAPSTFSWWGAWLNDHADKLVVVPREGAWRPGTSLCNRDFWPEGWIRQRALWPILDHKAVLRKRLRLVGIVERFP